MKDKNTTDNKVIDIEAYKPVWDYAEVKCRNCFYSWVAVYHIDCETSNGLILECPKCHNKNKVKVIKK